MSIPALAFLIAAALYTGFQWTIRLVVYPQLAGVGVGQFVEYERNHQRRVSVAVGPLFLGLGVAALAVLVHRPAGAPVAAVLAAPVLVAAILAVTGLLAVPQHRRLSAGFDAPALARLLRIDTVRVVLAVAATADAVLLVS